MIYWQLILVYLKIGMFGFGGGYAMLSLIQYEVVDHHHWLTLQQFTDVVAISQMTPGPIGINSATYVGYALWSFPLIHSPFFFFYVKKTTFFPDFSTSEDFPA